MTDRLDPRLAPVERRLERLPAAAPSAALRRRALAAVDAVLAAAEGKVPATKSGWFGKSSFPFFPDLVAGTFVFSAGAAAVATGIAIVAACVAGTAAAPQQHPPFAFAERLRVAGVADDGPGLFFVAAATAPLHPDDAEPRTPQGAVGSAARAAFRVVDARRILEEHP